MARFGDALAEGRDLSVATARAVREALAPLVGRVPDLVTVFVTGAEPDDAAAAFQQASGLLPGSVVIGCTAAGVIGGGRAVEGRQAVSVWVAVLPGVRVRGFHLEVIGADEGLAVVGLPATTGDDEVALLLADPYSFPSAGFVERTVEMLPGLAVVGGIAQGVGGPGSTRLLLDGRVVDRGAVGVFLSGPVAARTVVSQGCRPVGPVMTVTAAEDNLLLGLAGRPALEKVQEIVAALDGDDQALASTGLQLGVAMDEYRDDHGHGDYLVRALIGSDPARSAVAVADEVPVGSTVQLQVRDAESAHADLVAQLSRFFGDGSGSFPDTAEGALLVSCTGRGEHLFPAEHGSADHDVVTACQALRTSGVGGFFAGGEFGPVGGVNRLHALTASMLVFGSGSGGRRGTAAQVPQAQA